MARANVDHQRIRSLRAPRERKVHFAVYRFAYYAFDEGDGKVTKEEVSGKTFTINNVFDASNQINLMKPASDPLWRKGVKGNCLYMDGTSNYIEDDSFRNLSGGALTLSAWVAPRVFENNFKPEGLTCIVGKGDVGLQEGWLLGYGYLGTWGLKVALQDPETGETFTAAFYDPVNYLPLYEWSHVAASYDAETGRVCLYLNGEIVYVPTDDWVSGFFAGTLWYMYELTGDEYWADHARKHTEILDLIGKIIHPPG